MHSTFQCNLDLALTIPFYGFAGWVGQHERGTAPFQGQMSGSGAEQGFHLRVLQQVLEPVGEVQGKLVVYSEMYDSRGVRTNEDEEVPHSGCGVRWFLIRQEP